MRIFILCLTLSVIFLNSQKLYGEEKKIVYQIFIHGEDSVSFYSKLTQYINKKLKTNYIPIFEENAKKAVQEVYTKSATFGFICSGPYAIYYDDYRLEPMVSIRPSLNRSYRTYIITRKNKPYKNLFELKNKTFSMTYLESFTGRLVPLSMIKAKKEDPLKFFSEIIYSKTHYESIYNVLDGKAEGGAVMSLVYDYLAQKNPKIELELKIIDKSNKYPPPLFVSSKFTSNIEKENFKRVLINMPKDPEGKKLLRELNFDSFYEVNEKDYEPVVNFINSLKELLP